MLSDYETDGPVRYEIDPADLIPGRTLQYTRVVTFEGESEADVFISAGVFLQENEPQFSTIVGTNLSYLEDGPNVVLTLTLDGV